MGTNIVGDKARLYEHQVSHYIARGGPNDTDIIPNIWAYNATVQYPPIPGSVSPPSLPTYRTFNIATGILVGTLPQGAYITDVHVYVLTAFNATGNNNLLVGTVNAGTAQASLPGTLNNLVAAGDVNALAVGNTFVTRGFGPAICLNADQDLYIQYTQTGTAATQGNAMLVVKFTGLLG